eukprot:GHVT01075585.1.p1 GENE.GHVT01075585.1~~GHVT01075585.1.p1  ORF type:complete len:461 (+),score=136.86 GHVT01075585.1:347-1729(+)
MQRRRLNLSSGSCRGILVSTTSPSKTRAAAMEFIQIANLYLKNQSEHEHSAATPHEDVEAAMQEELLELKNEGARFIVLPDVTKGIGFVKFCRPEDQPSKILHHVLSQVKEHQNVKCKFVTRVHPVDFTCRPYAADFRVVAHTAVAKAMKLSIAAHTKPPKEEEDDEAQPPKEEEDDEAQRNANDDGHTQEQGREPEERLTDSSGGSGFRNLSKLNAYSLPASSSTSSSSLSSNSFASSLTSLSCSSSASSSCSAFTSSTTASTSTVSSCLSSSSPQSSPPSTLLSSSSSPSSSSSSTAASTSETWSLLFSERHMKTLKKEEVLECLDQLVGPNYSVNLTDATYTIIVEVNPVLCGISVVSDYQRLKKFNVARLAHPEIEEEKIRAQQTHEQKRREEMMKGREGNEGKNFCGLEPKGGEGREKHLAEKEDKSEGKEGKENDEIKEEEGKGKENNEEGKEE